MKRLERVRSQHPALEELALRVLDGGKDLYTTAKEMYEIYQDPVLKPFLGKRLTLRKLWNLRKVKYDAGPYKNKRVFSSRDSSKHIIAVLSAQGYVFKYPNNLDFIHNFFKHNEVSSFEEFTEILKERSREVFNSYAQMQIDAMLEYGHMQQD